MESDLHVCVEWSTFPLLCIKQWHADISITLFDTQQWKVMTSACHCLTHNNGKCRRHHFPLFDAQQWKVQTSSLSIVCLSTQIEGKWSFGSGIRIRYPDHHQNLMEWSLGSWLPSLYISFKSVHNFLSNPANRQTDRQTNRQTDKQGWIHNIRPTTLANVIMGRVPNLNRWWYPRVLYAYIYMCLLGSGYI